MKIKKKINVSFCLLSILFFGMAVFLLSSGVKDANAQESFVVKVKEFEISRNFKLPLNPDGTYQERKVYSSEILKTEFVFNAVGVEWKETSPPKTKANIFLRNFDGKEWSGWIKVEPAEEMGEFEGLGNGHYFSDLIFTNNGQCVQYKINLETRDPKITPTIQKIKITYIDSVGNISRAHQSIQDNFFKISISGLDDSELNIIPRSQWIDKKEEVEIRERKNFWPEKYEEPEKIIVHHTGVVLKDITDDGKIDVQDYLATMRAIYRWQAKIIEGGWRDIGYNYLIDPEGRIYEGRYGRDGVIGGHAVRSEKCDIERFGHSGKSIGFNRGTIGIALLGNFEKEVPTSAAIKSLIDLMAYKSVEFDIEPNGSSFFVDLEIPNIIGHRDVDCTLCPGKNLYLKLPDIRQRTQQRYEKLRKKLIAQGIKAKAKLLYQSDKIITLKPGEIKEVWADFKNIGNTTWHNYTKDSVYLAEARIKSHLVSLDSFRLAVANDINEKSNNDSLLSSSNRNFPFLVARLIQPNVKPGEVGTFKFTVGSSQIISGNKKYVLTWGNKGWFPNTDFVIAVNPSKVNYAAQISARQAPPGYFIGGVSPIELTFKNTGAKPWPTDKIVLNIYGEGNTISKFRHQEWARDFGFISPVEKEIKAQISPGETATFKFNLKNPDKPGIYKNIFKMEFSDGVKDIVGGRFDMRMKVEAPLAAEIISHNIPIAVLNVWRPSVYLRIKNVGNIPWGRTFVLESYNDNEEFSLFAHPEWKSKTVIERLEREVKPGQVVTFIFKLKPPQKARTYKQKFVLKMGKEKVFVNGGYSFFFTTRVDEFK
ncbi:MAG: N-acetylmuramoyl-L-alanine amidase [Armatimonadetes bacterium]|nr:N-acetylmuramoyl-L-alanine amidase [Armatimonadota bacterium]